VLIMVEVIDLQETCPSKREAVINSGEVISVMPESSMYYSDPFCRVTMANGDIFYIAGTIKEIFAKVNRD
jgi:hypothetical protein